MRYLLTLLTNGRRECFERAVYAFAEHASSPPESIFVMDDGEQTGNLETSEMIAAAWARRADWPVPRIYYESSPAPLGMCRAHAHCWHAAAASDLPWVFHLEDDFVLLRPLELGHLAETLDAEPTLTQLALVRTPWGFEIPHGGYIPQTPGHYDRRQTLVRRRPTDDFDGEHSVTKYARWIATQRNWATNPALFRTDLARRYPWPLDGPCERTIGDLILADRPDAVFGLWGWGEPWAAHVGVERQQGAYGYH